MATEEARVVVGQPLDMQTILDMWTVFGAEIRRTLKSPRVLLLLLLYLLFAAGVMLAAGALARQAQVQFEAQGQGMEGLQSPKALMLAFLFGQDRSLVESLLELPALLLLVFKGGLVFLPVYVALLGFDTVSAELQTRSLRYLTVRTSRTALVLGKGLALAAVVLLLVSVVQLGAFGYALLTVPDFSLTDAIHAWPRLWGTMALAGLAMATLTSLCSTLSSSPALSLTLNFAALLGFWAAGAAGSAARFVRMTQEQVTREAVSPGWQERLGLLAPSTWSAEMLYPNLGRALTGALALAVFAIVCAGFSVVVLRTRDV